MKRGDIVRVVAAGDYGKPRPALVVQSDALDGLASIILCLFTSDLVEQPRLRLRVEPSPTNGLKLTSHLMVDKINAVSVERCRGTIGTIEAETMVLVDQRLLMVLGLSD